MHTCCCPHTSAPAGASASKRFGSYFKATLSRGVLGVALAVAFGCLTTPSSAQTTQTIVQKHGKLRVAGNRIVDQSGQTVQLRGMSLYWSQWVPKFWNASCINWLKNDWKITVVRAAMAVDAGGYISNPTAEKNKVIAVVDAAIAAGIYVIIDWHVHNAPLYRSQAQTFFAEMAQRYGNTPNVLYEVWNEPEDVSWANTIKPYHQALVSTIRQYDPDNIIICGTRFWSQQVEEASLNKVTGTNIAYTLHFYAASHRDWLRQTAARAMANGIALFVTEYGTTEATGNGVVDANETRLWWAFLDQNRISHCNWSLSDIPESSSALVEGASGTGGWSTSQLKPSGQLVRNELIAKQPDLRGGPVRAGTYSLRNRASGKMLDSLGQRTNGNLVGQWTDGTSTNQRWNLFYTGGSATGGYAKLMCLNGDMFLDSVNQINNDTPIGLWAGSGGNNQQWTLQSLGSGYYRIVNRANGKAMDTGGFTGNTDAVNKGYMEFWTSGSSNNQQWSLVAP